MEKKDEIPPHITLNADDSTRIRKVGIPKISPLFEPLEKEIFVNKLNQAIDSYSLKLDSAEKTYFLVDLTLPYYNSDVQALLKRLNLSTKSMLSEFQILVSAKKENLSKYLEKGMIHKSTLKVIRDIRKLEWSDKIGKSLQKIIKGDLDKKKAIPIFIRLVDMDYEEQKNV